MPAAKVNPMPANGTCKITFVAAVMAHIAEIIPNTLALLIIVGKIEELGVSTSTFGWNPHDCTFIKNATQQTAVQRFVCASGGTRTHKPVRASDFKSDAYANSATEAAITYYAIHLSKEQAQRVAKSQTHILSIRQKLQTRALINRQKPQTHALSVWQVIPFPNQS